MTKQEMFKKVTEVYNSFFSEEERVTLGLTALELTRVYGDENAYKRYLEFEEALKKAGLTHEVIETVNKESKADDSK